MVRQYRDFGYMAQRSANPNETLRFLQAHGTLNPDVPISQELKKQYKLRSPKLTKALIGKFGIKDDVVSMYYNNTDNSIEQAYVLHIFDGYNASDVMRQQSDSDHFSSCMTSCYNGDRGSYYYDEIDYDISQFKAGVLGLFVVGAPHRDIHSKMSNEDVLLKGNGVGFVARAKIRFLFSYKNARFLNGATKNFNTFLYTFAAMGILPEALYVDRCYPNSNLLKQNFDQLVQWVDQFYPGLPIYVRPHFLGELNKSKLKKITPVKSDELYTTALEELEGALFYPTTHGYQDSLHSYNSVANLPANAEMVAVRESKIEERSAQLVCYEYKKSWADKVSKQNVVSSTSHHALVYDALKTGVSKASLEFANQVWGYGSLSKLRVQRRTIELSNNFSYSWMDKTPGKMSLASTDFYTLLVGRAVSYALTNTKQAFDVEIENLRDEFARRLGLHLNVVDKIEAKIATLSISFAQLRGARLTINNGTRTTSIDIRSGKTDNGKLAYRLREVNYERNLTCFVDLLARDHFRAYPALSPTSTSVACYNFIKAMLDYLMPSDCLQNDKYFLAPKDLQSFLPPSVVKALPFIESFDDALSERWGHQRSEYCQQFPF